MTNSHPEYQATPCAKCIIGSCKIVDEASGCWIWKGPRNELDHNMRHLWQLANGPLPASQGDEIYELRLSKECHPRCIRAAHRELWVGVPVTPEVA